MKRPLFIAAALVLSGIVCGVKESGVTIKAAAIILTAVLIVLLLGGYFEEDNPLIFVRRKCKDKSKDRINDNYKDEQQNQPQQDKYRKMQPAKRTDRVCLAAAAFAVFMLGFARGAVQSHIYNSPQCVEFYEYYKPTNPGLFDYSLYLKSLDISSRAEYEAYRNNSGTKNNSELCTDTADTAPIMQLLNAVKEHCTAIFDASLSEHDSGIYKAVILGDKSDMNTEIRDLYQDAGIAHLLAVSGLHVSMIGASLYNIIRRRMNAGKSAIAASIVLFMYMLLTGASGSVIRAVIMLILNIVAAVYGRNYCMTTAISISAIVVMMYRPYMIFTSGFQLSFGAVASISLISRNIIKRIELLLENSEQDKTISGTCTNPTLSRKVYGLSFIKTYQHKSTTDKPKETKDIIDGREELSKYIRHCNRLKAPVKAFIVSASIQLGTLPMIAYHFYKVPVYGILLNFIVIPLMAAVIASGMSLIGIWTAAGIISVLKSITGKRLIFAAAFMPGIENMHGHGTGISNTFAAVFRLLTALAAAPGHYVLRLYEILSSLSLKLPYATVCIGRPSMLQIIIYYLILAAAILCILKPRSIRRGRIAVISMVFSVVVILNTNILRYRDTDKLYVTAIDVGQGDSFLIKKGKHTILIDGGSSSRSNIGKNVIESFLMAKGITRLSCLIVSHADADHVNGIEYLLSEASDISTKILVLPKAAENDADYDELKSLFIYGEATTELFGAAEINTRDKKDTASKKGDTYKTEEAYPDGQLTGKLDEQSCIYGQMTSSIDRRRILYPRTGSVICQTKDFGLYCLYHGNEGEDKNRQSLVLLLKSGDFTMLFTGDTEAADERIFTDKEYLDNLGLEDIFSKKQLTVLKAAHHGSHSANSEEIFNTFKPQAVLISCGKNNRYGHPHEDVLERATALGSKILRTDESGAVSIYVDDEHIRIVRYKQ